MTTKTFNMEISVLDLETTFLDMNKALKKAVVNSLNTVGRKVNRGISADIKANYNIKARSLKLGRRVSLRRADARKQIPVFTISIIKQGRGLALYSPQKTPAGVSVKIKRSRKTVKGSYFIFTKSNKRFVARKSKKGGFVQRAGRKGKKYRAPRSEFLYGPSIAALYRRRKSFRVLNQIVNANYKKVLDENFDKEFEKKR